MPRTFRLTLEYDGGGFEGWQIQPGGHRTVQGVLEDAVTRVTGQRVRAVGSGRTDAGVHAEGQVASLQLETAMDADRLRCALNGALPRDVAVLAAAGAPDAFDARRDALAKLYRYRIWNGRDRSPLRAHRALHRAGPLDLEAMQRAARAFEGAHDFASFQATGSSVISTRRTLTRLEIAGEAGADVEMLFEGGGFLRHMVRILVGSLLAVGSGRWAPEDVPAILAARDRRRAGPTAPAHGLTLVAVRYAGDPPWDANSSILVIPRDSIERSTS
ncbi:MAG TPA: tRNA pseudouridine(38-40) synthase TruA [Longimicrobiales bacterium]|nr:tRNA pseudouridine(38-40) synthase TruA [Longimicrobiales bacterium]